MPLRLLVEGGQSPKRSIKRQLLRNRVRTEAVRLTAEISPEASTAATPREAWLESNFKDISRPVISLLREFEAPSPTGAPNSYTAAEDMNNTQGWFPLRELEYYTYPLSGGDLRRTKTPADGDMCFWQVANSRCPLMRRLWAKTCASYPGVLRFFRSQASLSCEI